MSSDPGNIIIEKADLWVRNLRNYSPNIIAAGLVIILSYLVSRLLKSYLHGISKKFIKHRALRKYGTTTFQYVIIIIGFLIALSILDLGNAVTSLLAGAGVVGLIIGLALQEIISSYLSGVTISMSDTIKKGDLVEINGTLGVVNDIRIRTTIITTPSGQLVEIPNKNVINDPIVNYTRTGERRIDIRSGIGYDDDRIKARDIAVKTISKLKGVVKEKPVEFFYDELGDSSVEFLLRFWMEFSSSQTEYYDLRSRAITALLDAFDENGITIPYPTTKVVKS